MVQEHPEPPQQAERPQRLDASRPASRSLLVKAVLLAALLAIVGVLSWPSVRASMTRFSPGDILVQRNATGVFGVVLEYETEHAFEGSTDVVPAYRIRVADSNTEVWLSERSVTRALMRTGA